MLNRCKSLPPCLLCLVLCVWLVACSSGDSNPSSSNNNPPVDQRPSNPDVDVIISGRITFDLVPHRSSNSALDYLATEVQPGRGLSVQLLDRSGQLLRETRSDDSGNFRLGAPADTQVRVRVLAELERRDMANWQIRVTDNTDNNALYAMQGSLVTSGSTDSTRNLHAASGWVDDEYNEERVAAPFAILDAVYEALILLENSDPDVSLEPAQIRWSVANKAVMGNPREGEIETSYFDPAIGHIYLLGWADNDTDEYDRSVIQHEFAHLIEHQLFRSDNTGGDHAPNELLDSRIAFSEGWGNAFASMASGDPVYRDAFGPNQDLGYDFSIEAIETNDPGWYSESSVANILYDIFDDTSENGDSLAAGFTPIYQAFSSPAFVDSEAFVGLHTFNVAVQNFLDIPQLAAYTELLAQHDIYGQDEFALNETNSGGNPDTLPLYIPLALGETVEVCTNNYLGQWNKLGNRRYLLIDLPDTSTRTVSISISSEGRSGDQADAWIDVYYRGDRTAQLNLATYNIDSENFSPDNSGPHILEYYEDAFTTDDYFNARFTNRFCADITVN